MHTCIDFNADIGEGCGHDAAIVPLVSSASIACGGHAGERGSMAAAIALCLRHAVAIGAHPGWEDRSGFGRRRQSRTAVQVHDIVQRQVAALAAEAARADATLAHVKPHGAMYNQASDDAALAQAIAGAVWAIDPRLKLYALAGSALVDAGREAGLDVVEEIFAERAYQADGRLVPRDMPGAVIDDLDGSIAQTLQILRTGTVTCAEGSRIALRGRTLCLHGDRPDAAAFARALRHAIEAAGITIAAPA